MPNRDTGRFSTFFMGEFFTELPSPAGPAGTFEFPFRGQVLEVLTYKAVTKAYLAPARVFTAPPSYQVLIYDRASRELVGIIGSNEWQRLRYSRVIDDIGLFMITLPGDHVMADYLQELDCIVEVWRYTSPGEGQVEETYMLRQYQLFVDEDDMRWLVAGGFDLKHQLARRVINPYDDPLEAGGYSTKSGPGDDLMVALVDEQIGQSASAARKIDALDVQPSSSAGSLFGGHWRFNNLLETLQEIAAATAIDFRIEFTDDNEFLFIAEAIGDDRTRSRHYPGGPQTVFAPERGTMAEPQLEVDRRQEKTYIYLLGPGQDDDREVYEAASARQADSPYNRIEFAQDAQTIDEDASPTEFLAQAATELERRRPRQTFDFTLTPSLYRDYRLYWDLGDRVTAEWNAVETEARIMEIENNISTQENMSVNAEVKRWI